MESALYTYYKKTVVPALKQSFGVKNVMQVPKVTKVVLNVGYGRHNKDGAFIENVEKTLTAISGQKPVHNKAKKAIANFKTRLGMDIGMSVTLRGPRMYDFLYRLIHITFPRVRDFRGLTTKGFDKQGNFTVGFKENIAFPESHIDAPDKIHGLQVIVSTTAKSKDEGLALLKQLGFPFKDK